MSGELEIHAGKERKFLCTNCGTLNISGYDFCANCGCPLNSYAQIDPIKRIRTYGFMFRSVVKAPNKPIILVGGWLILALPVIRCYLLIVTKSYRNFSELFFALLTCIFCFNALFILTRNYFVQRRHK